MDKMVKYVGRVMDEIHVDNTFSDNENMLFEIVDFFKLLKKWEKNNIGEWEACKNNLKEFFGVDVKGMSKNRAYLEYQSRMVNGIYELVIDLENGE